MFADSKQQHLVALYLNTLKYSRRLFIWVCYEKHCLNWEILHYALAQGGNICDSGS